MVAQRKTRPEQSRRVTYWEIDYHAATRDPDFETLQHAHCREMFPPEMGRPMEIDHGRYSRISAAGMLKCFIMRSGHRLIGYASYLVMPTLHHGPDWIVALNDVTYITPEHRKGMCAVKFLKQIEARLKRDGASVIYHHDPHRRSVAALFERLGYTAVQTTYEKVLKENPPTG
jgi:hypothetical protein